MLRALQLVCLCVIGLLVYTSYGQQVIVKGLQKEINTLAHDLRVTGYAYDVLQAEWAYANGPGRLKELLKTKPGQTLALIPRTPDHYIAVTDIPMGPSPYFNITGFSPLTVETVVFVAGFKWKKQPNLLKHGNPWPSAVSWGQFRAGQKYMP